LEAGVSQVLRHADDVYSDEERARVAEMASGGDALQGAITAEALKGVGGKYVTVRRKRVGEEPRSWPRWLVHFVGDHERVIFAFGVFPYGAATKREALEDADRICSKNGWGLIA
jgi:hypothetical protein